MRFFKKIFKKLTYLYSFIYKKDRVENSYSINKHKEREKKINSNLIKVREEVIKSTGSSAYRIKALSPTQLKLNKEKVLLLKRNNPSKKLSQEFSVFDYERLEDEVELLKTNLELQKKRIFIPQPISNEAIVKLKTKLTKYEEPKISVASVLNENRKIIKNLRYEDKKFITKKRLTIFKFSLIELFKKIEREKEAARLVAQKKEEKRIQNLKFDKSIKIAKKLIKGYDFETAEIELKKAISINSLRHKVVSDLKNEILRLKKHFEKQRAEFDLVFKRANDQMIDRDYEKSLKNFNKSKLFDININEVNKKIKLVRNLIQAQKNYEENFQSEKESYLLEIQNKRFIKAKSALKRISENFEEKEVEIENLQKLFDKSKLNYNNDKYKYKSNVEKAEILYLNGDLKDSNKIFRECLSLNINNEFCEKRIREIKHKQDFELKKQKLLEKKEKQEKYRLVELNKYKEDKEEILKYLTIQGITKFYHFTDESNLASIRSNNGLYSWFYCEENDIDINNPGGDHISKQLDRRGGLHNFVRLSFAENHPMLFYAQKKGRLTRVKKLEIDIETATFKTTLFSDVNATKNGHLVGNDLKFLKGNINFHVVKQPNQFNLTDVEKPFYQAEVMVEEHIESKYITNL